MIIPDHFNRYKIMRIPLGATVASRLMPSNYPGLYPGDWFLLDKDTFDRI